MSKKWYARRPETIVQLTHVHIWNFSWRAVRREKVRIVFLFKAPVFEIPDQHRQHHARILSAHGYELESQTPIPQHVVGSRICRHVRNIERLVRLLFPRLVACASEKSLAGDYGHNHTAVAQSIGTLDASLPLFTAAEADSVPKH